MKIIKVSGASYSSEMPFVLTQIAHQAKAHWNYPTEWIESWKNDLTVDKSDLLNNQTFVLQIETEIVGFVMIMKVEPIFSIEHFWINPPYIGKGYGSQLMQHILSLEAFKDTPIQALADPNAQKFYERHGFSKVADVPSSIPGRTLPLMERKNV